MTRSLFTRLAGCLTAAAATLAVAAPLAQARAEQAGTQPETLRVAPGKAAAPDVRKPTSAAACARREFSPVFTAWQDRSLYTLAAGGDFETAADGWTLGGAAAVAGESSPFMLGARIGASSLELPAGGSAVSPVICVGRGYPTFRFVSRSLSAAPGLLRVEVLYADGSRVVTGRLQPGGAWEPTRRIALAQGRFRIARGNASLVRLRFVVPEGTVRIDDVYVDPRYTR